MRRVRRHRRKPNLASFTSCITWAVYLGLLLAGMSQPARCDDWPQWLGPTRDGVWHESGLLDGLPADGPAIVWRATIAGGYAGPAVAAGRVFVTDFEASEAAQNDPGARAVRDGVERVLCFDAASGQLIWKYQYACRYQISYPAGPRATPTISDDKVYTLGAEGMLVCLDARSGRVIWQHDLKTKFQVETPMWGFTCHPLCDEKRVYCLTGGSKGILTAFDKNDGRVLWQSVQAQEIGYSSPMLTEAGGRKQLIFWHPRAVVGLNPETGELYWSVPIEPMYGMSIMVPVRWQNYLFVGGIGNQSVLVQLAADQPQVSEVYRGTPRTSLYPVCAPPLVHDGILYGSCQQGHFRGVKLQTGERLWETFQPTTGKDRASSACAFVVRNGDRFFLFNEQGDLIIARLTAEGYQELSRAHILEPTNEAFGRNVVWCHPAFAQRCMFVRNDRQLICVSLAK